MEESSEGKQTSLFQGDFVTVSPVTGFPGDSMYISNWTWAATSSWGRAWFQSRRIAKFCSIEKKKKITILPSEGNVRAVCTRWSFGELVAQCSVGPVCPKQQRGSSGATCLDINCSCCALEGLEAPRDETPRSPGQFVTVLSGPCSWKGLCIVWSEYLLLSLKQVMPCAICCKHREWFIALPAA